MPTLVRSFASRARPNGRGFTLIELIVIVVLVGILGVAAIASTKTTYQSKQRLGAQLVLRHLAFARERAIATGNATWATFNTATDTVTYSETLSGVVTAITDPATGSQLSTPLNTASAGQLLTGVEIGTINGSSSTTTIGFDWLGRPTDSGGTLLTSATSVTITASQGASTYSAVTITIQPETGVATATW